MTRSKSIIAPYIHAGQLLIWLSAAALVTVCIIRYCQSPSFWLDEAFIAVSVRNRSTQSVFSRLEYGQHFPRIYLAGIVALRDLLGYQIWVLRLLPALSFIVATVLWARLLSRRAGRFIIPSLFAGALLVGSSVWLVQAIQLKQYTLEVFLALIPFMIGDEFFNESLVAGKWKVRLALLVVPCVLSYSYPFAMVARVGGWYIQRVRRSGWGLNVGAVSTLVISLVAGLAGIWMTDHQFNFQNRAAYLQYWNDSILSSRLEEGIGSGLSLIANFIWGWHRGRMQPWVIAVVVILQALGAYAALRRLLSRDADPDDQWGSRTLGSLVLLAGVVLASLLLSYPMTANRLTLFTQVHTQALAVEGATFIVNRWSKQKAALALLCVAAGILIVNSTQRYKDGARTESPENIRPMLSLINREVSDTVWVHPCSKAQVESLPEGLPVENRLVETRREKLPLEGRIWVLWTNLSEDDCRERLNEVRSRAIEWQLIDEGRGRGLALAEF